MKYVVSLTKKIQYFAVLATIISTSFGLDYESYLAKLQTLGLDYGVKMSSVEEADQQQRSGPSLLKSLLSTKCTTGEPIKVDPAYVPESSEGNGGDSNSIVMSRDESKHEKTSVEVTDVSKKKYLAPSSTDNPYYVDDEK